MSKGFCTLIIIPEQKSSVRKISLSLPFLKGLLFSLLIIIPVTLYFAVDYIKIKHDKVELARLRNETREQHAQIETIAAKIEGFSVKMEKLKQFDRKIRIMANIEGNGYKEQMLGIGGPEATVDRLNEQVASDKRDILKGIKNNLKHLTEDAASQEKSFTELLDFLQEQKSIQAAMPSIWPVKGWVTSGFGYRPSPFNSEREFHQGIDIAARYGAKVLSTGDGIVISASYLTDSGKTVIINNGYGINTSFGHLSRIAVKSGARVKRGDIIGYTGNTGRSTGPHLHYSVSLNGVPVNPRKYLH